MTQQYDDNVHEWVRDYYGEVLKTSSDLKTNACCAVPPPKWIRESMSNIHDDVLAKFYGCGFPIPEALRGRTVLDLGCGAGRDVYLLAQLVGPEGRVHGVDMTEAQLETARAHLEWHREKFGFAESNVEFQQSYIEDLQPISAESFDVVVSNCVVNLSPRKDLVLSEAHRVMREGGEFYLSDVVVDRRLPESIARDPLLHSECLGGAMYRHDFEALARKTGFRDPRIVTVNPITIQNQEIEDKVGAARFFSITYRLFKLAELDDRCEDFGQSATYLGGLRGTNNHQNLFTLDEHHIFEAGRPERVCGNTAAMLSQTRFAEHFRIDGDRSIHFGAFDCASTIAADVYRKNIDPRCTSIDSGSCC